jgi:small subunit ribosomal protein S20
MAITKNAKKAIRSHGRKRIINIRRKSALHTTVKMVKTSLATGNTAQAITSMSSAYQAIDKAAKRGLIKKNTASRKKSRLMKQCARTKTS